MMTSAARVLLRDESGRLAESLSYHPSASELFTSLLRFAEQRIMEDEADDEST